MAKTRNPPKRKGSTPKVHFGGSLANIQNVARSRSYHAFLDDIEQKGFSRDLLKEIKPGQHRQRLGVRSLYRLGATTGNWYLDSIRPGTFRRRYFYLDNVVRELFGSLKSALAIMRANNDGNHFARLTFRVYMAYRRQDDGTVFIPDDFRRNISTLYVVQTAKAAGDSVVWGNITNVASRLGGQVPKSVSGDWVVTASKIDVGLFESQGGQYYQFSFYLDMGVNGLVDLLKQIMPPRPPLLWIQYMDLDIASLIPERIGTGPGSVPVHHDFVRYRPMDRLHG